MGTGTRINSAIPTDLAATFERDVIVQVNAMERAIDEVAAEKTHFAVCLVDFSDKILRKLPDDPTAQHPNFTKHAAMLELLDREGLLDTYFDPTTDATAALEETKTGHRITMSAVRRERGLFTAIFSAGRNGQYAQRLTYEYVHGPEAPTPPTTPAAATGFLGRILARKAK